MLDVNGSIYQAGVKVIDTGDLATQSVAGIVQLATSAEAMAGTNTTKAVTPFLLAESLPTQNPVLNSDFGIWQRGTSFVNPTSASYIADRLRAAFNGTGATRTLSRQAFAAGTAPVAGYEGQYYYRFSQTVAGTGGTSLQPVNLSIEDVGTGARGVPALLLPAHEHRGQ
jgi:hypothetical protein